MNILLDAHILGQRETGNETYIRELLRQTDALEDAGARVIAAVSPGQEGGARRFLTHPRIGDDVYRLTQLLPRLAIQAQADLVHVTYHGPVAMKTPMVVTIHDVSYRVRARFTKLRNILIQNALGYWTARRARLILTVSEFCRAEIARVYPFAKERIAVTSETSASLAPPPRDRADARLRALGLAANHYVFCIGRFQPRKNFARLSRAFLAIQADAPGIKLALAGDNDNPTGAAFRREFADPIARGQIVLTGYAVDADVSILYAGCACFAFPSLYEGFGLPVLEAMRLGAPVITSSTSALPEVAGDAGLLVDPTDEESIADALRKTLVDIDLAEALRARGRVRAQRFGGAQFAAALADAYHLAMSGTGP